MNLLAGSLLDMCYGDLERAEYYLAETDLDYEDFRDHLLNYYTLGVDTIDVIKEVLIFIGINAGIDDIDNYVYGNYLDSQYINIEELKEELQNLLENEAVLNTSCYEFIIKQI